MKSRVLAVALLLLIPSCTVRVGGSSGSGSSSSSSSSGERLYRVRIDQVRKGGGIASAPLRRSVITATIREERIGNTLAITIDKAGGSGERGVVDAAKRLRDKRLSIAFGPDGSVQSASLGVAGSDDLHSLDVALLFEIVSPVIPSGAHQGRTWTSTASGVFAPWIGDELQLKTRNTLTGTRRVRWVHGKAISTQAEGKVAFLVPLTSQAAPSSGSTPVEGTHLLSEVFATLFTPVDDDVAASAAKGLTGALLAPALIPALGLIDTLTAFGSALSGIFGGGSSGPRRATLRLEGPITLHASTTVGGNDDRVLSSRGTGSMRLKGKLPPLSGEAKSLSERPISLDADWIYSKDLVKPWPFGLVGPAVLLLIADIVGLVIVIRRRRREPVAAVA